MHAQERETCSRSIDLRWERERVAAFTAGSRVSFSHFSVEETNEELELQRNGQEKGREDNWTPPVAKLKPA